MAFKYNMTQEQGATSSLGQLLNNFWKLFETTCANSPVEKLLQVKQQTHPP